MKRGSAAPRKALRGGGFLGLASIFVSPFLLLLYIYCSVPSMWHAARDPRTDTADTTRKDVEKLSNTAISALQLHNAQNLAATLSPKRGKSNDVVPDDDLGGGRDRNPPPSVRGGSHRGEESSSNPWEELSADKMQFRIENHGYQCLVYTALARNTTVHDMPEEVSWVTQLTVDRLPSLEKMLSRWDGPVSAALYSRDVALDVREIERFRDRVDFHIVGASQGLYPVNTLRNVALNNARAGHVILADVDFIPSVGLYDAIRSNLQKWRDQLGGGKAVFVIPAFEMKSERTTFPRSKADLLELGDEIHMVHDDPARSIAHKYTDYDKWRTATEAYVISQYAFPYEPYFMAPKTIPRFDVRFYGYGNDKASHCYELDKAGYKFMVMPDAFLIHTPHPQGNWVLQTFIDPKERMSRTLTSFLADVDRRYQVRKFKDQVVDYAPLPPSAGFEAAVGNLGSDCDSACDALGKRCVAEWSERLNSCRELERYLSCSNGCNDNFFGADLPAFNTQREQCLINNNPKGVQFVCSSEYQFSRRLCPCGSKIQK